MVLNAFLGQKEICKMMLSHSHAKLEIPQKLNVIAEKYGYIYIKLFGYPLDPVWRIRARTVLSYVPTIKGKVLDIGCSFGVLCFELAKRGHAVIGIDINREGIELAEDIKKTLDIKNVRFINMDFMNNDFPAEEFDIVIMVEVLEHLKNDSRAVQEIYRILKKDGVLIVSVPYTSEVVEFKEPPPSLIIKGRKVQTGSSGELHFRSGYNLEKLSSLLEANRFVIIDYTYTNAPRALLRHIILFPLMYIPALALNYLSRNRAKLTLIAKKTRLKT